MSDEMIERVAKAMKDRCGILIAESFWLAAAQAAIQSMREPTDDMIHAGLQAGCQINSVEGWRAMIDAALTSSPHCTN